MSRYQEYSPAAAITMALSKGLRDFMNIYQGEKSDAERKKREDAEWKMRVGENILGIHNRVAANDFRERQLAIQEENAAADAEYRTKMLNLKGGGQADAGYPSPEGLLGHRFLTGEIDEPTYNAGLSRVGAITKKTAAEKEPPDFVNLFYNLVNAAETRYEQGRSRWDQAHAIDRLVGKDVPYPNELPKVANLFENIVAPRAARVLGPQAVDSIRGEAAGVFPELLLPAEKPAESAPVAPAATQARLSPEEINQAAIQSLRIEFGDEWNTAPEAVRNAALARRIKELGG